MDVPILGQLDPVFGFGLNDSLHDHLLPIGLGQAVCVIGNRIAIVSTTLEEASRPEAPVEPMTFLPQPKQFRRVTAVCTDTKRSQLAVCVEMDLSQEKPVTPLISPFQIIIYNLAANPLPKKTRVLTFPCDLDGCSPKSPACPFVSVSFSGNGLLVVAATEAPESRIIGWQWQRNKVLFSQGMLTLPEDLVGKGDTIRRRTSFTEQSPPPSPALTVTRVRFHPDDQNMLSTSGPTHVRQWRVVVPSTSDDIEARGKRAFLEALPAVKHLPLKDEHETYNDHTWTLDRRLVVVSSSGHVSVITDNDCREGCNYRFCHGFGKTGSGRSISTVLALPHCCGFVTGGEDGVLGYFDPMGSRLQPYRVSNILAASRSGSDVTCLSMESNELLQTSPDLPQPTSSSQDVQTENNIEELVPSSFVENVVVAFKGHAGTLSVDTLMTGKTNVNVSLVGQDGSEMNGATVDGTAPARDEREDEDISTDGDVSIISVTSIETIDEGPDKAPLGLAQCFAVAIPGRLSQSWHGGPVLSLSVCSGGSSQPLVATCCAVDSTVKIWNYRKGICVLTHSFSGGHGQTPRAVALHPNGMKLLVGFDDSFSLYHLSLVDGLILNHTGQTKGAVLMHGNGESGEATFDTSLITDRVTSLAFHKSGDSFAVLTGKTLQVFAMYSAACGGHVSRVQVMSGHHSDVACWGFATDLSKAHTGAGDGALFEWDCGGRTSKGRILKRSKDCVRSDISYLALDCAEDGALITSSYFKPPTQSTSSLPSPPSFTRRDSLEEDVDTEVVEFIGGRAATGFAAPSSLATMASVAQAGAKFKSKAKSTKSSSTKSVTKQLHRNTMHSASLLSIENDQSLLKSEHAWANGHSMLTVWPNAAIEGGRVDVHLSGTVGALSALSVMNGGYGGRQGLPSVLLGGGLAGGLAAFPWPLDSAASATALDLGEQASVELSPSGTDEPSSGLSLFRPITVATHSSAVVALAQSPEGDVVVSAAHDGSLFITSLRRSGSGSSVKLSASNEFHSKQPEGVVEDAQMVVAEGKVMATQRRQLIDLTRRVKEADATLKFELEASEKNHRAALVTMRSDWEQQVSDLKTKVYTLTMESKDARDFALKTAQDAEVEFKEAADEIVSVYETKVVLATENLETLQKQFDQMSSTKDASICMLQEKITAMEAAHDTELKIEKEKVAKEQAVMKSYVEFVRSKYTQALDEEEQRHDQEISGIANRQREEYEGAVEQLEETRRQKGTFERKNKELNERMIQVQEESLHVHGALKNSREQIVQLKAELENQDKMLSKERKRGSQWEDIAAQHAEEVKLLEKTKQVREHELHDIRSLIPKREGEVARAKKSLSEMNKVLESEAEQRAIREEKTKQMNTKHAWLEGRLRKEAERNDRLQRGLAKVAQQLNTLVAAQSRPEAKKTLDVRAWVEELGRLHEFVAPLINTNNTLDDQDLDLAKQQQDTHNKQLRYLEQNVLSMKKRIAGKHEEGKAAALRLRQENLELLETVADLRHLLAKKSADVKSLKKEAVKLRGFPDVASTGYGVVDETLSVSKSLENDPLRWKKNQPPSAHWPKPRDKRDLAVSSTMVPSNLARNSGLSQLSSSLRQIEVASALDREDTLQRQLVEERDMSSQLIQALEIELEKHLGSAEAQKAAEDARRAASRSIGEFDVTPSRTSTSGSVSFPKLSR